MSAFGYFPRFTSASVAEEMLDWLAKRENVVLARADKEEGWNAFIGDDVIGFRPCFRFPFSTVTKCKIAVDLQERYNKDIKMLDVDPTNYNGVWGKYISPDTLRRLAQRK